MIHCTPQMSNIILFVFPGKWEILQYDFSGGWSINQDLLLGNADRLPIQSLGWRGNPANTIWTHGRCVPIDAAVARRPPKLLVRDMDQKATGGDPIFKDLFRAADSETVACFLAGEESGSTSPCHSQIPTSQILSQSTQKIRLPPPSSPNPKIPGARRRGFWS